MLSNHTMHATDGCSNKNIISVLIENTVKFGLCVMKREEKDAQEE